MGARRIGLVHYVNFGPFVDSSFDFARPGLTGVVGQITWKPGSNDNGAGKSFLFDGIAWALWGRCLRADYKGDDIVRMTSKGGACVEVNLPSTDDLVRVVRYRKHPTYKNRVYLFINGNDVTRGTDDETQEVINHKLGMDFTGFQNAVAFGAREDVRSFFSASDAQRKQVLDQLLGLSIYSQAEVIARQRLKDLTQKLNPRLFDITRLEGTRATQQGMLDHLKEADDVETLTLAATTAKAALKAKEKARDVAAAALASANADLTKEDAKVAPARAAWTKTNDAYLKAKSEAEREVWTAQAQDTTLVTRITDATQRRTKHLGQAGKKCSLCDQPLSATRHAEVLAQLDKELAELIAKQGDVKSGLKAAQTALSAIREPKPIEFPSLATAQLAVRVEGDKHKAAIAEVRIASERVTSTANALQSATGRAKQLQDGLAATDKSLADARVEVTEMQRRSGQLEFWVQGFGNQGLKSFLIESEISEINKRATGYAQRLLGPGAFVRLESTTALKTSDAIREKMLIVARIPGCTESYAGASKGQKRRLDLSLLLAFRDLVASRASATFRQFFADELFDGVDETGAAYVVELLRTIADDDCPVVLVTHDARLKSAVDRVVVVRHEKEYSARLVESGATPAAPVKKLKKVPNA